MNLLKRKQEMEEYTKLHELEAHKNYEYENYVENYVGGDNNKIKLANYICNNISDDTDINNMKDIVLKCMTANQMKKILYKYAMKYHKQSLVEKMSLEDFKEQTKKIIQMYQWKAGGYYIEDSEWNVYTHTRSYILNDDEDVGLLLSSFSTHIIKNNQILFENSVHELNADDNDTVNYMDRLVSILDNVASNIDVEYYFETDDEIKGIVWILLWGTNVDIKDNQPNID